MCRCNRGRGFCGTESDKPDHIRWLTSGNAVTEVVREVRIGPMSPLESPQGQQKAPTPHGVGAFALPPQGTSRAPADQGDAGARPGEPADRELPLTMR